VPVCGFVKSFHNSHAVVRPETSRSKHLFLQLDFLEVDEQRNQKLAIEGSPGKSQTTRLEQPAFVAETNNLAGAVQTTILSGKCFFLVFLSTPDVT